MDELRESSLLFSLERLHETERERVERESRESQRKREEELARVAQVVEQRRRAAEEQRAAAVRLNALQLERERLEQERIRAMQRATIERARSEVEVAAEVQRAELEHQHRLKLAEIGQRERGARYRVMSWLGAALFVLTSSLLLGSYFGVLRPAQLQRERHYQELLAVSDRFGKDRVQELALERSKLRELEAAFGDLESKRAAVAGQPLPRPDRPHSPGRPARPREVKPPPCPDSGDPLQGCLGSGRPR